MDKLLRNTTNSWQCEWIEFYSLSSVLRGCNVNLISELGVMHSVKMSISGIFNSIVLGGLCDGIFAILQRLFTTCVTYPMCAYSFNNSHPFCLYFTFLHCSLCLLFSINSACIMHWIQDTVQMRTKQGHGF